MILRVSTPGGRLAFLAVAVLLAWFLCFYSIRSAWAEHAASTGTLQGLQSATRREPGNAENWYLLGRYWQYNLENPDNEKAIRAYHDALSRDPYSAPTYVDLATAYEAQDDIADARENFLKAKHAYPLSAEVSWRVGNFFLRQGELEEAFQEIRQSVAADPSRGAEAFTRSLRVEPDIEVVLDRALPPNPVVYIDIIRDLAQERQTAVALQLWAHLVNLQPNPSPGLKDLYPLVDALRQQRNIAEASRVWRQGVALAGLADLGDPSASVLWDGGFESGFSNFGYAWYFPANSHGVQIQLDRREKHSGQQSLRLTFDGKLDVNFSDVCHNVPVEPRTSYRLSAWAETRDLTSDQGVRLEVYSLIPGAAAAFTPEVHGTHAWTQMATPWISDAGAHEARVCIVRIPSDQPDSRIRGSAWLDDVALTLQAPAEAPSPATSRGTAQP
jgi:tetratricopeptide (TPR) repeat protein